ALVSTLLPSYSGRILGQAVAVAMGAVVAVRLLKKDRLIAPRVRWEHVRDVATFGLPLIPHVVGTFLISAADRLIIANQLGPRSAGVYFAAVQVALGMGLATDAANKAFVPWLYSRLSQASDVDKSRIVTGSWYGF